MACLLGLGSVYAQCPANDSALMGPGSLNDVFYSFKKAAQTGNGVVATVSNTNWHLAFSVMPSKFPNNPANGVAIRVNSPLGENSQAQTTGTSLVKLIGANASNWRNIDTTGLYALQPIYDNDSTWNLSAFTRGYKTADPFNFIWGSYNPNSHNVEGNSSVYVLYNKSANWYKKITIKEVTLDTMWNFVISNIDNTDSQNIIFNKKAYPKKLFVYYNVLTHAISDREPSVDQWDLVWTKYKGMVSMGPGPKVPYTVTGVLSNPFTRVARNTGKRCDQVWLANKTAQPQDKISCIGHDWKFFNGMSYDIIDTLVYFVSTRDSHTYKMTMKSFRSAKTTFNFYESTLSVNALQSESNIRVFPNPSNGLIQIESASAIQMVEVFNAMGQKVLSSNASTIDLQAQATGIYHLAIYTEKGMVMGSVLKN